MNLKSILTRAALAMSLPLVGTPISAQNTTPRLTIQPKVGMAFATLSGNGLKYDAKWRVGPAAGVELEWALDDVNSIVAGLGYRSVGCRFGYELMSINEPWEQMTATLDNNTLHYLSLPVEYKVNLVPRLALRVGLELNGLLAARSHAHAKGRIATPLHADGSYMEDDDVSQYQWNKIDEKQTEKIGEYFKNFTLSIPVGLSYEYRRFVLTATYHFEVTSAHYSPYTMSGKNLSDGYKLHNQAIDLTLGYRFRLR